MLWTALYLVLTACGAALMFLAGQWFREPWVPAPQHPGMVAVFAGLLWPVLATGLVQLGVLLLIRSMLADRTAQLSHRPCGAVF